MSVLECSRREKRRQNFGIDCNDLLVWKIWEPEQQYKRQLTFKNVEGDAQTISFTLPAYRSTFLTPFPEPITLRSGMSFTLDITFCPLEVVEVHDSIEVTVHGRGSFQIKLEGRIPYAKLRCTPKRHDFKFCSVGTSTRERITMTNIGTVPLEFAWEVPLPFAITPQRGFLKPNELLEAVVVFTPLDARPIFAQGVCRLASIDEALAVIELSGVGKYPHISFEKEDTEGEHQKKPKMHTATARFCRISHTQVSVDFGVVAPGSTESYELILENPSLVTAYVKARREDDNIDCPFQLSLPNVEMPLVASLSHQLPSEALRETSASFEIPRNGRRSLILTYKARWNAACRHTNVLELRAVAGNALHVSVSGMVSTSNVCTSVSYLNFGDVNLERLSDLDERNCTGVVQLKNKGKFPAYFQIYGVTPGGAFSIEPSCGTIDSRRSVFVKVRFCPTEPINYLRRLFIFVQNMLSGILYVDLFGSAYNAATRPPSFGPQEVETFFMYMKRGLGLYTPLELDMLSRITSGVCETNLANLKGNSSVTLSTLERMQAMWRLAREEMHFKKDSTVVSRRRTGAMAIDTMLRFLNHTLPCPFSMESKPVLTFEINERPQVQTVIVRNDSSERAIATWVTHKDSVFFVSPTQQEIPAGEQHTFQITLSVNNGSNVQSGASSVPVTQGEVGCMQVLECYMSYAQMKSFRNVDKHTFIPPYCLYVLCYLKTLVPRELCHSTRVNLVQVNSTMTTFASTRVGGTTHQIISLTNLTDTVISYEISNATLRRVSEKLREGVVPMIISDEGSVLQKTRIGSSDTLSMSKPAAVFSCSPSTGSIEPRKRALVVLCFHPVSHAQFEAEAILTAFSGRQVQSTKLRLLGESDVPHLIVTGACMNIDGRQLLLRPTCVTGESRHALQLYNPTSLRIAYFLITSPDLMSVLRFEPAEGFLNGGERFNLTAFFKPEAVTSYKGSVTLLLRDANDVIHEDAPPLLEATQTEAICGHTITWQVCGEGAYAKLEVEPTVMVLERDEPNSPDESSSASLKLYNSGRCELAYEVRVWDVSDPAALGEESLKPVLYNHTGILPARAHHTVLVTPRHTVSGGVGEYILYALMAGTTDFSAIRSPETLEEVLERPHCKLTVRAKRPAVRVADVRSLTQPRSSLYRRLSINELNAQLAAPVHVSDLDPSFNAFHQYISGLAPIAMNIAVGLQHATSIRISLVLENTGDCEAAFTVWLPTEADVSQEAWFAEQEELSDIQHILDASLIDIKPRHGTIGIGGTVNVIITYRFCEVGTHILPAVLRISDGRRALVLLEGRTMPPGVGCLMFHHSSTVYNLQPVRLGDTEPPMQSIILENPLDREVTYTVDVDSIRAIADQNYHFPILQCVAPVGTLAPYSMASVPWYFRPLEAIEYTMDVPIYTDTGESYTLTLIGRGYHPHKTPVRQIREWIDKSFFSLPAAAGRGGSHASSLPSYEVPVSLLNEVITFGAVPFHALYRRCCTLTNHHPTDVYSFKWCPSHTNGDHTLFINPKEGIIPPNGGQVFCRIAFNTGSVSQHLAWPVLCMVANCTAIDAEIQKAATEDAAVSTKTAADGEECFAADGLGALACGELSQRGMLFRKKTRGASSRQPVTMIRPESMSLHALSRLVSETRRQCEDNLLDLDNGSKQTAVYGTLELFLQARIMPVDYWEFLYEQKAKLRVYQPPIHLYADPETANIPAPVTAEELRVARNVLDELIHMIIAQPQIQSSFTQPSFVEEPVYYRDLLTQQRKATRLSTTDSATGAMEESDGSAKEEEQVPQIGKEELQPSGLLKCVLEVAMDELIMDIATSVVEQM